MRRKMIIAALAVALALFCGADVCCQERSAGEAARQQGAGTLKQVCAAFGNRDGACFNYKEISSRMLKFARLAMSSDERRMVDALKIESLFFLWSDGAGNDSVSQAVSELRAILSKPPFEKMPYDGKPDTEVYCIFGSDGREITDFFLMSWTESGCNLMGLRGKMTEKTLTELVKINN